MTLVSTYLDSVDGKCYQQIGSDAYAKNTLAAGIGSLGTCAQDGFTKEVSEQTVYDSKYGNVTFSVWVKPSLLQNLVVTSTMHVVKDDVCYQTEVSDSNMEFALSKGAVPGTCSFNAGFTGPHGTFVIPGSLGDVTF